MAKDYSKMNKEELLNEITKLESRKSYGLVWEDKKEDIAEQCVRMLPVLSELTDKIFEKNIDLPTNFILEGDNYHTLSALNYTHTGKIDVIYIDPPYNTGAKDWRYNNDYVDENDTYRHSKWISMMYKRMLLAKPLLKDDGVMIITIDDYELFSLLGIIEELNAKTLGRVSVSIKPEGRRQSKYIMESHEYIIFISWGNPNMRGLDIDFGLDFTEEDEISKFKWEGYMRRDAGREDRSSSTWYPIYVDKNENISFEKKKDSIEVWPINTKGIERVWLWSKERAEKDIKELKAVIRGDRVAIYYKRREQGRVKPTSMWFGSKYNANAYGTRILSKVLPENNFDYPKSIYSVLDSIDLFLPKNGLVLDFFAGSGTTGQAALDLNSKDGGNRCFILCTNNENKIAEEVTYPRVKNVIKGYGDVEGIPANLRYYKTDFVDVESVHNVSDQKKIELTYKAGRMIALREDTLEEIEKNDWWQIFTDKKGKTTAVYFKEDKVKLDDLVKKISKSDSAVLYIFSWGKNEYKNEFTGYKNMRVEDIPEPILEVYKEINKK